MVESSYLKQLAHTFSSCKLDLSSAMQSILEHQDITEPLLTFLSYLLVSRTTNLITYGDISIGHLLISYALNNNVLLSQNKSTENTSIFYNNLYKEHVIEYKKQISELKLSIANFTKIDNVAALSDCSAIKQKLVMLTEYIFSLKSFGKNISDIFTGLAIGSTLGFCKKVFYDILYFYSNESSNAKMLYLYFQLLSLITEVIGMSAIYYLNYNDNLFYPLDMVRNLNTKLRTITYSYETYQEYNKMLPEISFKEKISMCPEIF